MLHGADRTVRGIYGRKITANSYLRSTIYYRAITKIRGSYYGMCPEFLFTLSKLMSLLSEEDDRPDPSTIDPNVIQLHA